MLRAQFTEPEWIFTCAKPLFAWWMLAYTFILGSEIQVEVWAGTIFIYGKITAALREITNL